MKSKTYRPIHVLAAYVQLTEEVPACKTITKKMLAEKIGIYPMQLSYSVRPDLADVADKLIDCDPVAPKSA